MAGGYQHNPKGPEGVAKRIREIEAELRRLRAAITGIGIQIDPEQNALIVPSGRSILLDGGDLIAAGGDVVSGNFEHGTTGFKLDGTTGTPEFNDLILRGGIIGNDALTDPVSPAAPHADATGFNITTTMAVKAQVTVPVPSGYSKALVIAVAMGSGYNNVNDNPDALSVAVRINGVVPPGWASNSASVNGTLVTGAAAGSKLLTGLGSSFTIGCAMGTYNYTWTDGSWNTANIDATVLFLR